MRACTLVLTAVVLTSLLLACGEKWPTSVPERLPGGIELMPLSPGTCWTYRHAIYDSLPGPARMTETVEWRIGEPVILQGKDYLPLGDFFAVRPAEDGLFFAHVDTARGLVREELLFKTTARRGEHYTYTFCAPETTITYEIVFQITPVQNGERYFGASYGVWKVNGKVQRQGPGFLFRPGHYLKAIDRFPTPPFHFWAIKED
ncbi:MAG: hypothetical protein ONB25_02840 [candidate division KSB1 bacterium]|nr:hypothetical protein [candidate division KSB1 bacterium]MDZ7413180.1 hypothetical protein [candidate division KSB1 bacterium]